MPGIEIRHARSCPTPDGPYPAPDSCTCKPTARAVAYSARDGRKVSRSFPSTRYRSLAGAVRAAEGWRDGVRVDIRRGAMRAPGRETVRSAWEKWIVGAKSGRIRNRSGARYKPSALRSLEQAAIDYILPELGPKKLGALDVVDCQGVVQELLARGLAPSTIRNAVGPLRVLCRDADVILGTALTLNPTLRLKLPADAHSDMRFCTPEEVRARIATAPVQDRRLWATAFYAGLRRGELMALAPVDVDLAAGVVHVRRSYDLVEQDFIDPKSYAGRRRVPIAGVLRELLVGELPARGLVFGRPDDRPFAPTTIGRRAKRAWSVHGLDAVTLHQCRHTYASLMIAAGVSAKALQTYMGHASVNVTLDRYGHLMPDLEAQSASELDAYLARSAAPDGEGCGEVRGEVAAGEGKS